MKKVKRKSPKIKKMKIKKLKTKAAKKEVRTGKTADTYRHGRRKRRSMERN